MATIVTRAGKGSALTFAEGDANFNNLNDDKLELVSDDDDPSLGGNLNVDGNSIVSTDNGNIVLAPNGTGRVVVQGVAQVGALAVATNTHTAASSINLNQAHTTADANNINFARSRGTLQSPAAVEDQDELFELAVLAHDGTTYRETFVITTTVDNTVSTGVVDTLTEFQARTDGVLETYIELDTVNGSTVVNNLISNQVVYSDLATTGTITPDAADGSIQEITLSGNITVNAFAEPVAGQSITLIIAQPEENGPFTLTSSWLFAGGNRTLSTDADAIDVITVFYDGEEYYATLTLDYS